MIWLSACQTKHTLFEQVSSNHSGINFNNLIIENDSINPFDVVNIYNGGGVGIGDFNNDGLQDIYFTGNMVPCRLYLNKGNFKFEDITNKAGVEGLGRWARGVCVVDINNDGLMDLYICNTIYKDSSRRRNILYINQGIDKDGIPHFKDMAAEYGLDIHVQSTMASFFDYDNDGDLDMYLTVNEASSGGNTTVFNHNDNTSVPSKGRLYRNDMDNGLLHPVFHDVSDLAGITDHGYGHSATICDINDDGWKDIYVSDDFLSNNILYVNNHDGTFTNRVKEYFKHTSFNSMGQDVSDINNDGLPDVIELDMNPPDNQRKKMMMSAGSYVTYQNFDAYGYQYQYVRNTLQVNQGRRLRENDTSGAFAFSDIGFMSGIAQTDWSWTPLVTDFDNDSYRDIIITNGFPKDVSDHDFIAYRKDATGFASKKEILEQIPQIKLNNFAFHNNGNLTFSDVTDKWVLPLSTFSSGAAYADFDNDGALDMVINNINDNALLYRNTSRDSKDSANHFLQIKFKGSSQNINGLGATATIYYNHNKMQFYENNPYRGYLSTMQCLGHFGLGKITVIDSAVIRWNNNKKQTIKNVKADQTLIVNILDAKETCSYEQGATDTTALFKEVTHTYNINYKDNSQDFIDFNIQKLLPHKLSEYSPALAAGDIDGNGLDDLIVGGNSYNLAQVFLQQANGKFIQKDLLPASEKKYDVYNDEGILLFDANGDDKPDIYIASGGYKYESGSAKYQDRLYINNGKGQFTKDSLALPINYTSKLCVRAFDYNNDGRLDLFISGRVDPWHYPKPVSSCILRNDSKNGNAHFTDVTKEVAPELKNIGLVCDALFTDFDNDGATDLILAGEWMPITFLKNVNGKFRNVTASSNIANESGWWNSIVAGDFRHTGRTDYIVGNVGLNTLYRASDKFPVFITAKDFDNNGNYNAIPSLYLPDKDGNLKEFPAFGRDDMIKEMISIKRRFTSYKSFANATMDSIISPAMRKNALRLKATTLKSCYLKNEGKGKFTMIALPPQAQVSTLNGMIADDFDGDGNLDVLINGNDYGTDITTGRYDALNGLLLKGDGKGNFQPLTIQQSGIYIPGNGKALVKLQSSSGKYLVAASQNRDVLKLFELRNKMKNVKLNADDVSAIISFKNGKNQKEEFYNGSSFLSQSGKFLSLDKNVLFIQIVNRKGESRKISFAE
ncbi:MAG TPA: VCBS repeat-containing protein [Chitinophagaceae bacterium]|nr:VCBS repeat-containing protein [Chitinophagaceae bacterium]